MAKSMVYRLSPENFIDSINSRPYATIELLAQDLTPYDSSITSDNVAEKLADIFINIIKEAAGLTEPDVLKQQKQQQKSSDLKTKYGKYLLKECDNHCTMPRCGKNLFITNGIQISEVYEVSKVDKDKDSDIDNLVAMCPNCFSLYQMDNNKKLTRELKTIKKNLSGHFESIIDLDRSELDKGITNVLIQIQKLKQKDLLEVTLNPSELSNKIDPDKNLMLYNRVKDMILTYYGNIREILINLDKSQIIDYEDIQYQMRSIYKKLKKKKKNELNIFNEISEKLHRVTLRDIGYCQIVVCYFIQSCEVFDAISQ